MDELEISGKRYISAGRAAKENRYHSDYIGQLLRANKVRGQKVGRAWYVDEESLQLYLRNEPAPSPEAAEAKEALPVVEEKLVAEEVPQKAEPEKKETPVTKQEEDIEEEKIKIVKKEEIEERAEENIEEVRPVKVAVQKTTGLTYLSDEESFSSGPQHQETTVLSPLVVMETEGPAHSVRPPKTKRPLVYGAVLAVVGLTALAGGTLFSSYLSARIAVVEGQTATTSYSLEW